MDASDTQAPGTPAVVRLSRLVTVMRPLVKLLNPVMIKLAGRRHMRNAFGPAERAMFRVLGIRQYLLLHRAAS